MALIINAPETILNIFVACEFQLKFRFWNQESGIRNYSVGSRLPFTISSKVSSDFRTPFSFSQL